ncbi:uncharacterized protein LOC120844659 [Ixodes scapularis]|uniref:uncharacterized protein LOC120844659 n=1 Tax=Ixodes scapularis TaxID=6945 RepID=UPI001A9D638E|nr:uncharacterized protein LOC120844659 [Ixodes scapularis]
MERLKRRRGVIRSTVTKLVNDISSALELTPLPEGDIEEKLNFLTLKETSLHQLDAEIADLIDQNEIEEETQTCTTYEEAISNIKTRTARALRKQHCNERVFSNNDTEANDPRERQASGPNVKLPRLELPKYNGDLEDWQTFWDQFQSSIDHNPTLSPVDKLKYLKIYLVGKADAAVKRIPVTSDNYSVAIELLKRRFGQPTVIVNNHLSHLMDTKPIRSSEDTEGLRKLNDDVVTRIRSLQSLGVDVHSYGVLLHTVLQRALPSDLLLRYNRKLDAKGPSGDGEDDLTVLLAFLDADVITREKCFQLSTHSSKEKFRPSQGSIVDNISSASAHPSLEKVSVHCCVFCGSGDHPLQECTTHLTLQEKKEKLKHDNKCFRCG